MAALFAALAGMLFGALAMAVRDGLRRGGDPETGGLVVAGVGFVLGVATATPQIARGFDASDLWPFFLAGAIVPGATQTLFILAIRHEGPSRASVPIGTAPLMSVLIAIAPSVGRGTAQRDAVTLGRCPSRRSLSGAAKRSAGSSSSPEP